MRHVPSETHACSGDRFPGGLSQFHGKHNRANSKRLRTNSVLDRDSRLRRSRLAASRSG